ncbi:MAG: radical SAM family heme chaperone HemW [Hyphomicrobium sp.]
MTRSNDPFGVYIHWPFCAQKCPYCDFNSHVRHQGWDEARFLAAYRRELDHVAALLADRRRIVSSIFFGGGTPSLMNPATTAAILDHIAGLWSIEPGAEVTLEANPGSVESTRFAGYRSAGVNRVSMGLQSLRDDQLKRLGRIHSVAEAKVALDIARRTFDRFSFDLIYARPGQTPEDWRAELKEALGLAGRHLSLYQLTIEPDTPYAALHAAGKLAVPEDEEAEELYAITQEMTEAAGLPAYEISNHATPGEESRHNLLYWRYGEYAGVGPGAHGRLIFDRARHATVTERGPEAWAGEVERTGHGFTQISPLTRCEEADEMLLMGLRLKEGLDLERLAKVGDATPSAGMLTDLGQLGLLETIDETHAAEDADNSDIIRGCIGPAPIETWGTAGQGASPALLAPLAGCEPSRGAGRHNRIRVTPKGRFVLNEVVRKLSQSFETLPAQDSSNRIG